MLKSVYDPANIGGQIVNLSSTQTLVNKTLTAPIITDFTNANHNHSGASQGGLINSDNITEGSTHLFSPFIYSGGNYTLATGNIGLGSSPIDYKLDIFGKERIQELTVTTKLTFGGVSLTGIQTGTGTNNLFATKNYVDDQVISAGGYNDEQAEDAVGGILDNGTVGDIIFTYNDAGNKISGDVKDNSHLHNGTTISGLAVSNFTSPNISNWTNNANYVASSYALSGALSGTIASPAIASNAVTVDKLQTVPTNRFLGRVSSGTGNIEVLTVTDAQGMLGLGSSAYTASSAYATASHTHSDLQPLDGDLTSIAGISATTGLLKKTGTNTWTLDPSTYITGINSGMVTTALGYTPYNGSTNPNNYVTSSTLSSTISSSLAGYATTASLGTYLTGITYGMVTSALGYTPYNGSTNPNGFITSSALSGYATQSWVTSNFLGSSALSGYSTQTTNDGRYLLLTGGTLSGNLSGTTASFLSVVTASNFTLSDIRLKENISDIDHSAFRPLFHQYTMKSDPLKKLHYGAIAQEVEKYAPELVNVGATGVKSVNYTELLVLEVARLEDLVKTLDNRIKALEDAK